jgi:hypothetical protein
MSNENKTYQGSCHCGNVKFSFEHDGEIESGLRCNCSICIRKGAVMTPFLISPEELKITLKKEDSLGLYEFDTKVAHHFFCKICGIYTFNQTARFVDQYRVNLGCIEGVDSLALEVDVFNGKDM